MKTLICNGATYMRSPLLKWWDNDDLYHTVSCLLFKDDGTALVHTILSLTILQCKVELNFFPQFSGHNLLGSESQNIGIIGINKCPWGILYCGSVFHVHTLFQLLS